MSKTYVVAKGRYAHPHNDIAVEVDRYVIAREKDSRFILLKLRNKKNVTLSGVTVTVNQFDADGNNLGAVKEVVPVSAAKGRFVLTKKIAVDPACVDFTADIDVAEYGNYRYSCAGGSVVLDYVAEKKPAVYDTTAEKRKLKGKDISIAPRKFRSPVIIYFLAAVLLACIAAFTWLQLNVFIDEATGFRSSGIEYTFSENEDGGYDGVMVSGYAGKSTSVTIPATVSGYEVLGIGDSAFKDNKILKEVNIDCEVDISSGAFYGCTNLKSVTCGGISHIGDYAFYGCTSLESVSSDNAVTIGEYAFYNCSSLVSVSMSEEAESVGDCAFSGCSSLVSLSIPESVTYYGADILQGCDSLEYLALPYLYTNLTLLFGGSSYIEALVPSTLTEVTIYGETTLSNYAFYLCTGLKIVTFSGDSSSIGAYAFSGCVNLVSVIYEGDSLRIENHAFDNCMSFKTLDTSAAISYVGDYAFAETRLSEIDLSTASYIGDYAFSYTSLVQADMDDNSNLTTIGDYAFSNCQRLAYVSLPSGVTEIGYSTFANCSSLTTVQFSSELTVINNYAFSGCTSLTSFEVPSTVTTIGYGFLAGCNSLKSLTLPFLATYLSYYFGSNSCYNVTVPSSLTDVTISGGYTIPNNAFYYCSGIETVTLPDTVGNIGDYAFSGCSSLKSLVIPSDVTFMGVNILSGCNSLQSLTLPYLETFLSYYFGSYSYYNINVPSSLAEVTITGGASVPDYAFYWCSDIHNITIPEGTTSIGRNAFYYCTNLESVNLPDTVESIGDYAFNGCSSLKSLVIPSAVTYIGAGFLSGCGSLQSLTLPYMDTFLSNYFGNGNYYDINVPSSLAEVTITGGTSVPDYAFYWCSNIRTITLNNGITYIGQEAFSGCTSLCDFEMPSKVQTIGYRAFGDCRSLKSIEVPSTVTSMGNYVFEGCYRLYEIGWLTSVDYYYDYIGFPYNYALNVYYDAADKMERASYGDYEFAMTAWDNVWYLVDVPDDEALELPERFVTSGRVTVTNYSIPAYLFYYSAVETVYIPASVEEVMNNAFQSAGNLKEVYFAQGSPVTQLNEYVFSYCTSLTYIELPENLEFIWSGAFMECTSLSSVTLPESLWYIGYYAFSYCRSLTSITLPQNLLYIEDYAFNGCSILREVHNNSTLMLEKGGDSNGMVAKYALVIYENDSQSSAISVTIDGMNMLYDGTEWYVTGAEDSVTSLVLGDMQYQGQTITSYTIASYAFYQNNNLTSVTIGSAVSEIPEYAFYNCGNLKTVDMSASMVAVIGDYSFHNCYNLTSVTFPSSLESIGENAFGSCYNIAALDFSGTALRNIGYGAFSNDNSIKEISFSSVLESIEDYAFTWCTGITELDLPSTLYYIGGEAFYYNTSLIKVTLRSYVTIDWNAFNCCYSLYEIYDLAGMGIEAGNTDFGYIGYYAICVYDSETAGGMVYSGDWVFAYYDNSWWLVKYAADNWGTVEMPESFTDNNGATIYSYKIAGNVFYNRSVGNIVVPLSVTYIDPDFTNAAYNIGSLYYKGTEDGFDEISGGADFGFTVYYYADCVHDEYHWTYNEYGGIQMGMEYYEEETQSATCSQKGGGYYVCSHCGEIIGTYTTDKTCHTPDEDGTCTVCGAQGVILTEANLNDYGITVENDASNPFNIENGVFTSTNNSISASTITFTAEQDVTVYIAVETSFDNSLGSGFLNVYRLSGSSYGYGLGYHDYNIYSFDLQAGESIEITSYKQSSSISGSYDDCLYIRQFIIYG